MKIGIITILKVNNYGAELQAYATQAFLKAMGHNVEIIDYLFYKNSDFKRTRKSRPIFKMGIRKGLAEFLYPIITHLKERDSEKSLTRKDNFDSFHRENTTMSRTFRTIDELYSDCPDYDAYIAGSDQIWNPCIYSSILPYLLDFAPVEAKRIAYASSFGVSSLPENVKSIYKTQLTRFDSIGVRERAGVEIVEDLGLKAENVLDPTLMLTAEEWDKVKKDYPGLPKKYVAVYELTPSEALRNTAKEIARRLGIPVVMICKSASPEDADFINIVDAGPAHFLSIMKNAEFVVTNSFHGTAFSINFCRPFYTLARRGKNNNSRQINLLNLLGLTDRLLFEGIVPPEDISLDFTEAMQLLMQEREKSKKFIKTALNGE